MTPTPSDDERGPSGLHDRVARLWAQPSRRGRRGPQDLSVERIVDAAITVADVDGLDAVSMRRLADVLGSAPMSLYRHVASKDDLLELMLDAACGWAPERPAGAGWRGELEAWARALLRVYLHHPWLAGVALPVLVFGPRRLSWLESALESLTETTLDLERAADVVLGLDGTVRSSAQMIIPLTENPNDEAPLSMEALIRALLPRLDPERYPRAAAVFAAGGPGRTPPSGSSTGAADGTGFDPLASFEFQLATYLDGVAALDERGAPGRRPG